MIGGNSNIATLSHSKNHMLSSVVKKKLFQQQCAHVMNDPYRSQINISFHFDLPPEAWGSGP